MEKIMAMEDLEDSSTALSTTQSASGQQKAVIGQLNGFVTSTLASMPKIA